MKSGFVGLLLLLVLSVPSAGQTDYYAKRWSRVYKYEFNSLPKSALPVVDSIYAKAKLEHNITEFIKALQYQSKFALALQEEAELSIVDRFEKEIQTATSPLKNILESKLAGLYWDYFQSNQYKYYNRTDGDSIGNDFRLWDQPRMLRTIHHHFQNSLRQPQVLQHINLASIDELLAKAEASKYYRPTLYDFLAHEAINFYSSKRRNYYLSTVEFNLKDSVYFDRYTYFSHEAKDSLAPEIQALTLYKQLLDFHQHDQDPAAYVQLALERLSYLKETGEFNNGVKLYKTALQKLRSHYAGQPVSAMIDYELASTYFEEGKEYDPINNTSNQFKKCDAAKVCEEIIAKFPTSKAAEFSKNLLADILSVRLQVTAEEMIPSGKYSRLRAEYVNVDSLTITVVPVSFPQGEKFRLVFDSLKLGWLKKLTPTYSQKIRVINLKDHQEHSTEIPIPPLSTGLYVIYVELPDTRKIMERTFAFTTVQVTDLAITEIRFSSQTRYHVVNRSNGAGIDGATVRIDLKEIDGKNKPITLTGITDRQGFMTLTPSNVALNKIGMLVTKEKDTLRIENYGFIPPHRTTEKEDEDVRAKPFLFTDRSIYRPGQSLYFKGIVVQRKGNVSSLVTGESILVSLQDANGQTVDSARLRTNSFGSFQGKFKLPSSGLTGLFTLTAREDTKSKSAFYENLDDFEESDLSISVEEYKRPTFEVTFDPVKESLAPNDSVTVHGQVKALSGAPVSGATIEYTVSRYKYFWSWDNNNFKNSPSGDEFYSGTTTTSSTGSFRIKFKANPEKIDDGEKFYAHRFTVEAEVTDVNGETRSGTTTVNAGYKNLLAHVKGPSRVDRSQSTHSFHLVTENLNAQPIPTKGTLSIRKSSSPQTPHRSRPWDATDLPILTPAEFEKYFPHDVYLSQSTIRNDSGKVIREIPFTSSGNSDITFTTDKTWALGSYKVTVNAVDEKGNKDDDVFLFEVTDPASQQVADNRLLSAETDKSDYTTGSTVKLKVGSASPDITVVIDVEFNDKLVNTMVKHLSAETASIDIPVTTQESGLMTLHVSGVNFNDMAGERIQVPVLKMNKSLEIETLTFNDKLLPGAEKTWSFRIKSSAGESEAAEVLASMYDASLDQFKSHEWFFDPIESTHSSSESYLSESGSFAKGQLSLVNQTYNYYRHEEIYFDQFDSFGFSITNDSYILDTYRNRLYSKGYDTISKSKVTSSYNKKLRKGWIIGKVVNGADGIAMPGVNVVIYGTTMGTITDNNGNYSIAAKRGDKIFFSYLGMSTAVTTIGKQNVINVELNAETKQLSEVVITAGGSEVVFQSAISISENYAPGGHDVVFEEPVAESVSEEKKPKRSFMRGVPGGSGFVALRGKISVKPSLYVVDGVIMKSAELDQDDIASMQILKNEEAVALYGAQASGGVIIITTKSAQKKLDEEIAKINVRKNFNETAFFFPQLSTDEHGQIQFSFTTPESFTRWKLQLLAHSRSLLFAKKILPVVTEKELMVIPNVPRFVRTGDELEFTTKITNLTAHASSGNAILQLTDAVTGELVDTKFQHFAKSQSFSLPASGSTSVTWKLKIPGGIDAVQYKIVASAGNYSDGEQNILPVLSDKILVTETLPMTVQSGETKSFTLKKLASLNSSTVDQHRLTLEVSSNPAWYAVQALPYLMEFPYECAEQTFARYYANSLGNHVVSRYPRIKKVFNQWSSSAALMSNLEKNQDLKSTLLQETPWVSEALSESEVKKKIGLLFELTKLSEQQQLALSKLEKLQTDDGGFTWFPGDTRSNQFITQHIVQGFGHLLQLKVVKEKDPFMPRITKAIQYLDTHLISDFSSIAAEADSIKKNANNQREGEAASETYLRANHLSALIVHYLYARSFYPGIPVSDELQRAIDYYRQQTVQYWTSFDLSVRGMIALSHFRAKNKELSYVILKSLQENSITQEELGMYWKENTSGYYWQQAPIETQALLIEVFTELNHFSSREEREKTLSNLSLWLLKQKQTKQWPTTKATTEAIYALLLNESDWLSIRDNVEITAGGKRITPDRKSEAEAGTGYLKVDWKEKEIKPELATVKLAKKGDGPAWAGLYWQYFERLDNLTSSGSSLSVTKRVYQVVHSDKGESAVPIANDGEVPIGSLIRIHLEIKIDRDMEFLHMKDLRAAGLEPVSVLSQYKWQNGLGYYQSTKDASTHFFFDHVSKGVYVFEYDLRANNKGSFSNAIATLQCMYAPEFSGHSSGIRFKVR